MTRSIDGLAAVLILAFVVYRIARVMTVDAISDPWRAWLYSQVQNTGPDKRSFARWALKLLTCPYCLGVWLAFIVVLFWSLVVADDWLGWEYPLAALAVAGAQSLMTSADKKLTQE